MIHNAKVSGRIFLMDSVPFRSCPETRSRPMPNASPADFIISNAPTTANGQESKLPWSTESAWTFTECTMISGAGPIEQVDASIAIASVCGRRDLGQLRG